LELRQFLSILANKLWLIIALPLAAGCAGAFISLHVLEPVYESSVGLYVIDKSMPLYSEPLYGELGVPRQLIEDYKEIIRSRTVTTNVIYELKLEGFTPEMLAKKISISAKSDARILEIKVRDKDPQRAKILVDKVGEVFKDKVAELMGRDIISIIDLGMVPQKPAMDGVLGNITIAVVLGLIAALAIAFLPEYIDGTARNAEDVARHLGLKVLGVIPLNTSKKEGLQ